MVAALDVPENMVKHLFDEIGKDGDLTRALDVGGMFGRQTGCSKTRRMFSVKKGMERA